VIFSNDRRSTSTVICSRTLLSDYIRVQSTNFIVATPFYKLTDMFKSEIPINMSNYFGLTGFWARLYTHKVIISYVDI
jgi:hypothetical protein